MYLENEGLNRRMAFLSTAEQLRCKANDHTELLGTLDLIKNHDAAIGLQVKLIEQVKDIAALERVLARALHEAANLLAELEPKTTI